MNFNLAPDCICCAVIIHLLYANKIPTSKLVEPNKENVFSLFSGIISETADTYLRVLYILKHVTEKNDPSHEKIKMKH